MPTKLELIGERFGRLVVLADGSPEKGRRRVVCACDCGASIPVEPRSLRAGKTKSCGCLQRDVVSNICANRTTHGKAGSPEYVSWVHMKGRCENPSNPKFKDYGARGIKVCPEWSDDFARFLSDMGAKPSAKASIDRIDVNSGYSPENCRWADPTTQARNKRNHRYVEFGGEQMPLSQACEMAGINYRSALYRLNAGQGWMPAGPAAPASPKG